ncbi:hypothetical protein [Streptomyces enissocaesilis]
MRRLSGGDAPGCGPVLGPLVKGVVQGPEERCPRCQLRIAARAREPVDQGIPVEAACRIVIIEDQLEGSAGASRPE